MFEQAAGARAVTPGEDWGAQRLFILPCNAAVMDQTETDKVWCAAQLPAPRSVVVRVIMACRSSSQGHSGAAKRICKGAAGQLSAQERSASTD